MSKCILVQTEKAYQAKLNNVFVLSFIEKNLMLNKIELEKILLKNGLEPLKITTTKSYQKLKRRGKSGKLKSQFRPKKYYVKLQAGQAISEDTLGLINEKLNPSEAIK
ncbi:MAG: hypothetical protein AAGF07_00915 [Patescibacteria group bacterium]